MRVVLSNANIESFGMPPKRRGRKPQAKGKPKAAPKETGDDDEEKDEVTEEQELLAEMGFPVNEDEPEIPWKDSKAKALLRQDMVDGVVPRKPDTSMPTDVIFTSRPECALYGYRLFGSRLSSLRGQLTRDLARADKDWERFQNFQKNNIAHTHSAHGYPEWEGSEAQARLRKDMALDLHNTMEPAELWCLREEYDDFPLKVFRDHIYQEIRTKKFYNYLEVYGKPNKRSGKKNSNT